MICEERLLKVILATHISEKSSMVIKNNNTIVLKVIKDATKLEIKTAIKKIFNIKVNLVRTLLVKGKIKRHGQRIGRRNDWKKAYVTLQAGQNIDCIASAE
ncbi:50S ribosomal protein L23 [Candidatus Profftia lariciata]|uniref:50S ribosomal protein L23 n=1 Tax=Candidatus Profftia lariciata TaxID=1987921 RepID=UPI001D031CB1|nr:50S ribosomal protein L23 [Candidatus Profftia lariciata]UDG81636.1 50S ribosomal protein L23 [Candidatus Profftia lariciata]